MTTPVRPTVESTRSVPKNPDIAEYRRRLRDKAIDKSATTLIKLELPEMTLYPSNLRGDAKPMAKRLMRKLGSLTNVLRAPVEILQQLDQVGPAAIAPIKITKAAVLPLGHSRIKNLSVLRNGDDVQVYCTNCLAHKRQEHFIILCLGNQNWLISEETMSFGTVNQTAVCTQEVVNAALKHQAQALNLLQSHIIRELEKACAVMGITLHDPSDHDRYHMRQLQKSWAFVSRQAAPGAALFFFDVFGQFTGHLASFPARRQQARTRRV